MFAIRSVLWIGPATGLAESGVLDCPRLDVTWVPAVGDALTLKPSNFDVEILEGDRLADVLVPAAALLAFAGGFAAIAAFKFRFEETRIYYA